MFGLLLLAQHLYMNFLDRRTARETVAGGIGRYALWKLTMSTRLQPSKRKEKAQLQAAANRAEAKAKLKAKQMRPQEGSGSPGSIEDIESFVIMFNINSWSNIAYYIFCPIQ